MKHPSRHIAVVFVLAVLAALAVGSGAATAAAEKHKPAPCWKTLINDWYDGRIDGTYAIHCYRDALKHLPTDVETYSSARDDIKQALRERLIQSRSGGTGTTTTSAGKGGTGGGGNPQGPKPPKSGPGPINSAFRSIGPSKATSVPIPLIVLGGVALLLMAAGGAGFLARRTRMRKLQLASAASLPKSGPQPPQHRP